jgi:hypothetical protein
MLTNQEPDWNIDALTDTEIYTAIHYLEPDSGNAGEQDSGGHGRDNGVVICVCFIHRIGDLLGFRVFLLEMKRFSSKAVNETH